MNQAKAILTSKYSNISARFSYGKNLKLGNYVTIEDDVKVGDNVVIGDYVKLHSGTRIGDNVRIDDYCNTSGAVLIGNDVVVKRMCCLTQGTIIEDQAFIGPGIMIIHEKNVSHMRNIEKISKGVLIEEGAIIGGSATLVSGITIGRNAIVAAGATVVKSVRKSSIVAGVPAKHIDMVSDHPEVKLRYKSIKFSQHVLDNYLPDLISTGYHVWK